MTNKPNSEKGAGIYKYLYLRIQDVLAAKLITGELVFNPKTKEHVSAPGVSIEFSSEIDGIVLDAQDKFGFDDSTRSAYEFYFKDCLSMHAGCVLNRLNLILFNPYCMSPMVMFFLATRVASIRYTPTLGVGISEFFLRVLKAYNRLLDMPLDVVVINSMYAKFKNDEANIAASCSIWVENYNVARRANNTGLIWFTNEMDSEVCGQKNSKALWDKLSCQVYEDIKLQSMYQVCVNSGYQPQSSEMRRNVFSLYILLFDRLVAYFHLDYCGIGVIPLFGQLLFTSIALHDHQVVLLDVLKEDVQDIDERNIGLLLETARDVALHKEDLLDEDVSKSVIHNYKHIASLVCS